MRAVDIMNPKVYVVGPEDTLATVRNLMIKRKISKVLVYEDKLLGVITDKDIANAFLHSRKPIDEIFAKDIMVRDVITGSPEETPKKIAQKILEHNISIVPIMDKDELLGIITKTDLLKYFVEKYKKTPRVSTIMSRDVITTTPFHSAFHALKLMEENNIKRVVVVDGEKPIGIVTERDLALLFFGKKPKKLVFLRKTEKGLQRSVKIYPAVINDLMRTNLITADPRELACSVGQKMLDHSIGSVVVVDNKERLRGIVTKTDFVRYIAKR